MFLFQSPAVLLLDLYNSWSEMLNSLWLHYVLTRAEGTARLYDTVLVYLLLVHLRKKNVASLHKKLWQKAIISTSGSSLSVSIVRWSDQKGKVFH